MILAYLLILSAIAVGILVFNFWKYKELIKVPGPAYFFIFATTLNTKLTPQDAFKNLINLNKTYGPVVKLWINPLKPMLIVSDPKYVKLLLSSNVHLDKSQFYNFFHPYIGKGIGTAEAQDWKVQRKIANPAFRGKTLEDYVATMEKFGNKLVSILSNRVNEASVDVFPILSLHTLEVICATILNLEETFDMETNVEYLKAREGYFGLLTERLVSLIKQNDFLFRFTGSYERHRCSLGVLNGFTKKIVGVYLEQVKNKSRGKHLIDYLLGGYSPEDSNLANNISTFLIAGHETIATTLSFTLYELAKHQDVQIKILEERHSVLGGDDDKDDEFSFAQLQQMKYLECVLKESMRKYTPIPFFDRRTGEEMVIDGFRIPKGTDVSICAYNIHHNEDYFPDPEEFVPERFSSGNEGNTRPHTYIPFSQGPRNCIGKILTRTGLEFFSNSLAEAAPNGAETAVQGMLKRSTVIEIVLQLILPNGKQFAMIEMKLVLAKILQNYEIHVADVAPKMKLKSEFALKSTIGMPIKLTRRI